MCVCIVFFMFRMSFVFVLGISMTHLAEATPLYPNSFSNATPANNQTIKSKVPPGLPQLNYTGLCIALGADAPGMGKSGVLA
jgi:hypothetical protein